MSVRASAFSKCLASWRRSRGRLPVACRAGPGRRDSGRTAPGHCHGSETCNRPHRFPRLTCFRYPHFLPCRTQNLGPLASFGILHVGRLSVSPLAPSPACPGPNQVAGNLSSASALARLSCCNKAPRTGRLTDDGDLLLMILEIGSQRSGCQPGRALVRARCPVVGFCLVVSSQGREGARALSGPFFIRSLNPPHEGATLMT